MNREIKFRAWFSGIPAMVEFGLGENNIDVYDSIDDKFTVDINNADSIMQYTGLKDRNGKEIFEGDVVMINHWKSSDLFDYSKPFLVKWQSGQINFKQGEYNNFIGSLVGKLEIEVIGNIHENPELL